MDYMNEFLEGLTELYSGAEKTGLLWLLQVGFCGIFSLYVIKYYKRLVKWK